ncbi:MAG: hypothetical protein MJ180_05855, partial [Candidatus Gastranaerophilales bacterium]|nr:hypothetical protein [Candidatus Gastranaerophilales bacterium]
SSASGSVTGNARTGGLVGYASGSIDKSYATGDVEGVGIVGGLVGYNYNASISNSYSLSNVSATGDYVGGAVGQNRKTLEKCYSAGNVTGTGTHVGGFAGEAASLSSNKITDCYTTNQELDFYGANTKGGTVSGCHGANDQTGVTGHEPEWFNDPDNIKPILGETNFDYKVMPPDIKGNERPVPPPPPPPPPTEEGIQFQIGANSGEENTLTINTNFSLNGFDADVTTREKANETIDKVDALISEFSIRRSGYGAVQNRLESVMDSLTTKTNNLSASHSTIVDTDFAAESANLVKAQILQNATAALLAQANSAPSIALRLLE